LDEWMDIRISVRMNKLINKYLDKWMNIRIGVRMKEWIKRINILMKGWINEW